jgi:hypothetical protein
VARYQPFGKYRDIEYLRRIPIAAWKGNLVSGGVASFGTILEFENAIVVLPSEGDPITLGGEPITWRVFPGSFHYQNHLHVIYDEMIEIYSFNQDYFVKQDEKIFGSSPISTRRETGTMRAAAVRI